MNKNDKREEEEALSLFMILWSLFKLWRRGYMEISAAFRRGFFTEENSRIFGYSRVFLSLAQVLDVEIFLTSVLLPSRVEIMDLYKF